MGLALRYLETQCLQMDFPPHSSPGAMSCSDRNTHHPLWPLAHPHLLSSKFWQWTNGSGQLLVIEELDCWNGFSWLTEVCGLVLTSWTPGSWGLLFLLLVVCGVWLRTLGKWSVFILSSVQLIPSHFHLFPLNVTCGAGQRKGKTISAKALDAVSEEILICLRHCCRVMATRLLKNASWMRVAMTLQLCGSACCTHNN